MTTPAAGLAAATAAALVFVCASGLRIFDQTPFWLQWQRQRDWSLSAMDESIVAANRAGWWPVQDEALFMSGPQDLWWMEGRQQSLSAPASKSELSGAETWRGEGADGREKGTVRRTLYVRPTDGLGNHLQTMATALTLAKLEGFQVRFVLDSLGSKLQFSDRFMWEDLFSGPELDVVNRFPWGGKSWSVRCPVLFTLYWQHAKSLWWRLGDEEVNCIHSCCLTGYPPKEWMPYTRWFYRALTPAPRVAAVVDDFQKKVIWNNFTWVGVHMRRSDRMSDLFDELKRIPLITYFDNPERDILPIEEFIKTMKSFADLYVNTTSYIAPLRFFLATDDEDASKKVRDAFADDLIVERKKELPPAQGRHSKEGMQDALVDLKLLASCRALIGTPYSSFSKAAHFMGNNLYVEPEFVTGWSANPPEAAHYTGLG